VVKSPENAQADSRGAIRARRTRLQSALLSRVPEGTIQYGKKLIHLENLPTRGVRLVFHDQTEAVADLVVGADGIQSVRRSLKDLIFKIQRRGLIVNFSLDCSPDIIARSSPLFHGNHCVAGDCGQSMPGSYPGHHIFYELVVG
jgi:2-polyprenyl-6-methoxyphenol hydroxylase-like FAD-dependent oxidoreductase